MRFLAREIRLLGRTLSRTIPAAIFHIDVNGKDDELIVKHIEAYEVGMQLKMPAPDPMSMMHLYQPMSFRRQESGRFKIITETSEVFEITDVSHALLLGVDPITLSYGQPVDFHILIGDGGGVMTSDKPDEIYIQYIAFHNMHGRVLVGGLGLGMAANMIAAMPDVSSVTVIEKEPDIIQLLDGNLDLNVNVIQADLFEHINQLPHGSYDSAYYDVWYSTSRREWASSVVPLYRTSRRLGIQTVGAWGEHEMVAQLAPALYMQAMLEESASTLLFFWVFVQALKKELGGKPPYSARERDRIRDLIRLYLYKVGTPEWERTFPWDAYSKI
jgi:hypothetical protein